LPRPYDLVLFFTADNCKLCETIEDEISKASVFYYEGNGHYPAKDGE